MEEKEVKPKEELGDILTSDMPEEKKDLPQPEQQEQPKQEQPKPEDVKVPVKNFLSAERATEIYTTLCSKLAEIGYKMMTEKKIKVGFLREEKRQLEPIMDECLKHSNLSMSNPWHMLFLNTGYIMMFKIAEAEEIPEKTPRGRTVKMSTQKIGFDTPQNELDQQVKEAKNGKTNK